MYRTMGKISWHNLRVKQSVTIMGRNTTGPPCSVGLPNSHVPAAAWSVTDDDDRRLRAKQYWPLVGLPRVLEYSSTTRVVNYSSNFFTTRVLVYFYFRLKISFPVAVFAVIWRTVGAYVKFGPRDFICNSQPGPSAQQNSTSHAWSRLSRPQIRWLTSLLPLSLSVTAWIKVLPVLMSTRVLVKVLGRVLEYKITR